MHARSKLLLAALAVAAVAWPARPASADSLYAALGAQEGIARIVDEMLAIVLLDERIKADFEETNIDRLKGHLAAQFCQVAGGPCEYLGRDMASSHRPLHVTTAQFNALVEDLQLAMERAGVPYRVQNRLLARLAPMQRDIVTE